MTLRTITAVLYSVLLVALALTCYRQHERITVLEGQRATMLKELKGKAWELDRVKALRPELDELRFMAEVFRANDRNIYRVSKAAYKWGRHYAISPYLIVSVAHRESNFNPRAVSSVGAIGIMQIMPKVWGLDPCKLEDIDYNIQQGARILRHYHDKHGDPAKSLFHYWGGNNDRHGYGYPSKVLGSKYFNVEVGG